MQARLCAIAPTCFLIIDARGASITYGQLGGVVCSSSSSLSVRDAFFCLFWAEMLQGYVFGGAEFEKSGPESIRKLLDPESGS